MAKIGIPTPVFQGIKLISELNSDQINAMVTYISALPVDTEYDLVSKEFNSILKIKEGKLLLKTILSFSELIKSDDEGNELMAKNLTESYIELSGDKLSDVNQINLKSNLFKILSNFDSIKQILYFRKNYFEDENNLSYLNLVTDLRLVFKEDLENKDRAAVILHKLHFEYMNDEDSVKSFITFSLDDLNDLKAQIEKAIQKEQILRDDYKDVFKFLS